MGLASHLSDSCGIGGIEANTSREDLAVLVNAASSNVEPATTSDSCGIGGIEADTSREDLAVIINTASSNI
jgi:hypothetical protein